GAAARGSPARPAAARRSTPPHTRAAGRLSTCLPLACSSPCPFGSLAVACASTSKRCATAANHRVDWGERAVFGPRRQSLRCSGAGTPPSHVDRMPPGSRTGYAVEMRFRTWPVAALGLGGLLLLIVVSMLTLSRKAQAIYAELDHLNTHHHDVDTKLRRLRSDANLSGIFVRDSLLDVASERAPEYRRQLAAFRAQNIATLSELRALVGPPQQHIDSLQTHLEEYWETFEPLFDWTPAEKILQSARFLRREVVPRRDAVLAIAQEIEELNNTNLSTQRAEV